MMSEEKEATGIKLDPEQKQSMISLAISVLGRVLSILTLGKLGRGGEGE